MLNWSYVKYDWQSQNSWSVITQGNCQVHVFATDRLRLLHHGSGSYKNAHFCSHLLLLLCGVCVVCLILLVAVISHSVLAHYWIQFDSFFLFLLIFGTQKHLKIQDRVERYHNYPLKKIIDILETKFS